ncbi:MAG: ABC transporter permease [Terracidiphilus sp.]
MSWWGRTFRRRHLYNDLSEEVHEHIEEKTEQLMRLENLSRTKAREAALRAFGNPSLIEQRSREAWQWPAIESLLTDVKLSLRRLRNSPGFTMTVILTLAIGIGANTAVFSVVNVVLIKPLAYPEPEQLVALNLNAPGAPGLADFRDGLRLSASMYLTFAAHNRTFQSVGVWEPATANVTGLAQPEQVNTVLVSDGVLQTFAVPPAAGRWLNASDQDPRGAKRVMLGYGYWQRRFGGDRSVVGRTIDLDSQPREIVGVMPRGFRILNYDFDLLVPLAFDQHKQILAGFIYRGIARLEPSVSIHTADADVARLLNVWMDSWTNCPTCDPHFYLNWKIGPALRPMKDEVLGGIGGALWVVMGTIGVVMLIACTNVANLLLVRADARQQELAVRAALGAGRARIMRELLLESLQLALIGGVGGTAVAAAGLRLLLTIAPANLPRLSEIGLDGWSLAFALALAVFSGLFFGSIPALKYAQTRALVALRAGGRTASLSRDRQRVRSALVIAQVAMALVLLVSAVLMIRTFAALRNVDPGFSNPAHIQTLRVAIPPSLIADRIMVTRTQNSIAEKLAAIPGVASVGFTSAMPLQKFEANWDDLFFEHQTYKTGEAPLRLYNYVSPGYFHTAGTKIVAGRDFTWTDTYDRRPVGILSENLARECCGSAQAAIGKRFSESGGAPWHEVIGVVEDVRMDGVGDPAAAVAYWPILADLPTNFDPTRAVTFAVRSTRAGTPELIVEVQRAVWSANGSLPVADVRTMGDISQESMARTSFTLVMLTIAGSMALALGLLGIFGVISYAVSQRTREIGIRLALGAQKASLRWMFVRSALALTGAGIAIGLSAAAVLVQLMKTLLFGIHPLDPVTFAAVPLVLVAAAVLASYLPTARAAAVNPADALKAE